MNLTVAVPRIRLPRSQFAVIDCYAAGAEALVDFANAPKPGTSFELVDLDRTSNGDPAGGHLLVLRAEFPAWEAAARAHGVRLVVSGAPIRTGTWPGDAVVSLDGSEDLIIEIPS